MAFAVLDRHAANLPHSRCRVVPARRRGHLVTVPGSAENERLQPKPGAAPMNVAATTRRSPWLATAMLAILCGCAPDSVTNRQATGFNAYLDQIAVQCKPLMIGQYDMTYRLTNKGIYGDDFNYFFDLTSQLFYQRTSPAAYRSGVNGFFGGGATTDRSIDCIIATLPADRPKAGPPVGGLMGVN
jgi:hypothetical protein